MIGRGTRHTRSARTALVLLVAGTLAGCGSEVPKVSGSAIFTAHCAICHSISGPPAPEQQGGDLGEQHLPRYELRQFTIEMPVENRRLTRVELRAVVSYLLNVQRR